MNTSNRTSNLVIGQRVTNRSDRSTEMYLTELGRIDRISAEDEVMLCERIKKGDLEARNKLVEANLRFAVSIAKIYCPEKSSLSDYINVANMGLIKAAERFDSTQGFKFITFAVWWVRSALTHYLNEDKAVRIPANQKKQINDSLRQFEKEYPALKEFDLVMYDKLAKVTDNTGNLRALGTYDIVSGSSKIKGENSDIELFDTLISDDDTDKGLIMEDRGAEVLRKIDAVLPTKHAMITKMCFGIGQEREYSLDEIATMLDISRERVRQIRDMSLKKLKKHLKVA